MYLLATHQTADACLAIECSACYIDTQKKRTNQLGLTTTVLCTTAASLMARKGHTEQYTQGGRGPRFMKEPQYHMNMGPCRDQVHTPWGGQTF